MSSLERGSSGAALVRLLVFFAAWAVIFSWTERAHAYPWMIRHGFDKCSSCHEDPMGGETLTGFGRVISDTTLSTRYDGSHDPTRNAELFFGVEEPSWWRIGGSVRWMTVLYTFPRGRTPGHFRDFPMQADTYGQVRAGRFRAGYSLGASKVPPGSAYAKAAQVTSFNGPGTNNNGEYNLLSRSHWIGYDINDAILVRAGRINLPFGVRIPEHVMWVRTGTRTDRESDQQHGVAMSYSAGAVRGEVMAILGNYQIRPDEYRERGYSAYGEYMLSPHAAVGISSLVTHAANDRILQNGKPNTRQAHGATARIAVLPPLALLAEADVLLSSEKSVGYTGMLQADYEFIQGVHAMATGEVLDGGKLSGAQSIKLAGQPAFGAWLSMGWFFFTHFDARLDFVFRQESPVALQAQIHYYF